MIVTTSEFCESIQQITESEGGLGPPAQYFLMAYLELGRRVMQSVVKGQVK